jgi:hypothetical protein
MAFRRVTPGSHLEELNIVQSEFPLLRYLGHGVGPEPGANRLLLHGLAHEGDLVDAEGGRLLPTTG